MIDKLTIPTPEAPSRDAINKHAVPNHDGTVVFVYDPESLYGGLYFVEQGRWSVYGPFQSFADWNRFLSESPAAVLSRR